MIKLKKLTLTLVALLSTAAGAWAQTDNVNVTPVTGEQNKWTFTMPASNVELQVNYVPSYNVTFNTEGLDAEEAAKFTATPNTGVYKDQTVTVTYTGTKRLIGFKAVKKAAAPRPLAEAVAADLGKIAGADGNIYDTKAAAETAGTTAVAMIAYVGSSTEHATYTHGLAIALANEAGTMNWLTAKSTCEGKSAATNAAWLLPSQNQWKAMFKAFGNNDASYGGLNTAITNAGGTALQEDCFYWSSTLDSDSDYPFRVWLNGGDAAWLVGDAADVYLVRACLAF